MTQQLPLQNFTSVTTGPAMMMTTGIVEASGVFVGTLNVQVDAYGDGTWVNAVDPTSGAAAQLTGPGALRINNGIPALTRLSCSAYTSGTLVGRLIGTT